MLAPGTDKIIECFWILSAYYGVEWFKDYLQRRKDKKRSSDNDYSSDYARKSKISPILHDILRESDADRVQYWEFSNGEKTLSGRHLKKLSIFLESNIEGELNVADKFQIVPIKQFESTLDTLYETSDEQVVSLYSYNTPATSMLNGMMQYDIMQMDCFKVTNDVGSWTGIVTLCYKGVKHLDKAEVGFIRLQVARLSTINDAKYNKK